MARIYDKQWSLIKDRIGTSDKDIPTFTITKRKTTYFSAKVNIDYLEVDKALEMEPTCNINSVRKITYSQFEEIYGLYSRYVKKENGIREQMRKLNNNSTYIIGLINYLEI